MVHEIGGGRVDDGLASPFADHVAAEPRSRPNPGASWAASDESLCDGPVDGLSSVRAVRSPDYDKFWHHRCLPAAPILLGTIELPGKSIVGQEM